MIFHFKHILLFFFFQREKERKEKDRFKIEFYFLTGFLYFSLFFSLYKKKKEDIYKTIKKFLFIKFYKIITTLGKFILLVYCFIIIFFFFDLERRREKKRERSRPGQKLKIDFKPIFFLFSLFLSETKKNRKEYFQIKIIFSFLKIDK